MAPSSPSFSKRTDPRNVAIFLISLALLGALCYKQLQPAGSEFARVRLSLSTIDGAVTVDVHEDDAGMGAAEQQQQLQQRREDDILAAALQRSDGEADQERELEQLVEEQEEEEQQEKEEAQQQQGKRAVKQPEAPAKSDEQRFREFAQAVGRCYDHGGFECLTKQADMEPGPGQFRFPHFFIAGFQKCATTSLFHHLADHPQVEEPDLKEPEFFTKRCEFNAMRCRYSDQRTYMREILRFQRAASKNFTTIGFEGSTHYVLEGRWLAAQLQDLFPWLKIVISMRDPISQAIAMVFHNLDHNRNPHCFENNRIFKCVYEDLDVESRYSRSLRPWLKHFPREQLHIMQYENITSDAYMRPALRELKRFLGIHVAQPSDNLGLYNYRHQRKHTQGWRMSREEYLQLVDKARRNGQEVVEIVRQYGFADADKWMDNWEKAWQENLDENCEPDLKGTCMIQVT